VVRRLWAPELSKKHKKTKKEMKACEDIIQIKPIEKNLDCSIFELPKLVVILSRLFLVQNFELSPK
jgi:hypothetical protein